MVVKLHRAKDRGVALKPILFCVGALLINLCANRLVNFLEIPLFVDNIGTLLAAALGGYFPGVVVGYLTNVVNMTADPANVYYAGLSVLIAIAGSFFAKKGFFDKYGKAILTVPVFAFLGGVLGSLLTYNIYGFGIGEGISAPFVRQLLLKGYFSVFEAQMLSDVVIDLIDKFVTVLIVVTILKLIPESTKKSFSLTAWSQRPLTEDESEEAARYEKRRLSLRRKITIILAVVMVLVATVTTTICFLLYHNFAIKQYKNVSRSTAKLVASSIDADKVDEYLKYGEEVEGYSKTYGQLKDILDSTDDIKYIYVYHIDKEGCHVVFDIDTADLKGAEPGSLIPFDDAFMDYVPDLLAGNHIPQIISDETYGWLLTDYEPVIDSLGYCVAYAAADVSMSDIKVNEISFLAKIISIFTGFIVLIMAFCLWISKYHLVLPINAMTIVAQDFAYKTEQGREGSVERLKHLDIRTGDEIENLYDSLSKTIAETVSYMEDLRVKSDTISKMQNGLILVLADMVENRDKNTGDHVKKTAAYTKLILKEMKKKGIYPDIVDDKYVENVANSTPLHDVGKIKISDTILNKPGKLTDEEFEIMKTHTLHGARIVENAMAIVPDSDYLNEARNIATYHHEKWDGSGYPKGLKGEEIPLSARVMAVADVFDALVSKRSYKEPFPFEKAVDIIREGSGKHFDPTVVEVFMGALDKVKAIADEYERILEERNSIE
ncbi:MAG: HD domain-containing protein [Lachnospiraceae bacterium]|nr:HD domain-containing protein [Lachnospiraceae bacterium]